MLQQTAKPPQFTTPDSSAGVAEITRLEAFVLACWRNGDVNMLRTLTNSLTGPGGMKLYWHDDALDAETDE